MSRRGYWCGPDGRDEFYRTFCNDPFWRGVEELDALTDREASEYLLAKYVKPASGAERVREWEKRVADSDAAFRAMPIEEQRAAYLVMCRDHGIPDAAAEAEWDRLQREGG